MRSRRGSIFVHLTRGGDSLHSLTPVYVPATLSARVFTRKKMGAKTSRSSPRDGRFFAEMSSYSRRDEGRGTFIPINFKALEMRNDEFFLILIPFKFLSVQKKTA